MFVVQTFLGSQMARITPTHLTATISESGLWEIPEPVRLSEKIRITASIIARPAEAGVIDFSKFIPRKFSGYFYLLRGGSVISTEPIQFQNQQLLSHNNSWSNEGIAQSYMTELSTPDVDLNALLDEFANVLLYFGESVFGILENLNIPVLNTVFGLIGSAYDSFIGDNLWYLPIVDTPTHIGFSLPTGVQLSLSITYYRFSPIAVGVGLAEIDIDDLILEEESDPSIPSLEFSPVTTLENSCILAGFGAGFGGVNRIYRATSEVTNSVGGVGTIISEKPLSATETVEFLGTFSGECPVSVPYPIYGGSSPQAVEENCDPNNLRALYWAKFLSSEIGEFGLLQVRTTNYPVSIDSFSHSYAIE